MTAEQLSAYMDRHMDGRKAYATEIECALSKDGPIFRFETSPFDGAPPFHRWQWVHAERGKLDQAIADIGLRSRPDLKYNVAHLHEYQGADGKTYACAVLYR
jgi:hypothetical protein